MTRAQALSAIADLCDELGDDELEVLATIAARLSAGQRGYGPLHLARDSRNFLREAEEENLDRAVYEAIHYRQRLRGNGRPR